MMKGWIYKIYHRDSQSRLNEFPRKCYIGQTSGTVEKRWSEHKRSCLKFKPNPGNRLKGKHADLYEVMSLIRIENFVIDELEELEAETEDELLQVLADAENRYIDEFNSIDGGWNKVRPPKKPVSRSREKSLAKIANESNVAYTSLLHRVKELGENIEEAIFHLKELANQPTKMYEYGRQRFECIAKVADSKIHNPNDIPCKSLEKRIRELKNKGELDIRFDEQKNENVYSLPESIFKSARKNPEISVITSEGDLVTGSIKGVHEKLLKRFPDIVPSGYTTVQGRLNKPNWDVQQSFGFEYPPDLMEVKSLIEDKDYKWACGKPDFKRQNSKPVVLHSRKEVFVSQTEFVETYKGLKTDLVSDRFTEGKTAEEILRYYGLEP